MAKPVKSAPAVSPQQEIKQRFNSPRGRALLYITCFGLLFSLLAWLWVLPFPALPFLGTYQMYLNWASIGIAVIVYWYYTQHKSLSFWMLLVIVLCSYVIVSIEGLVNGEAVLAGTASVLAVAIMLYWLLANMPGGKHGAANRLMDMLKTTLYGWYAIFPLREK